MGKIDKKETKEQYTVESTSEKWSKLFSSQFSGLDYIGAFGNAFSANPFVQNQRVKNLKSYPTIPERDILEKAVVDQQNNEMLLRQAS